MFDKKGVFWFLGLIWLISLVIYLPGGFVVPDTLNIKNVLMLMPAFSAILLVLFFLPESPIYYRQPAGKGRWFYYFFILFSRCLHCYAGL